MRIHAIQGSPSLEGGIGADLQRSLKPHTLPVITLAVDATSTLLATGGADGLVKVWDIRGGYTTHVFRGHSGIISALCFFESATHVLDNGVSEKDKKKDRRKRREPQAESTFATNGDRGINTKSFKLASGSEDGKIRIWDLLKRSCVSVLDSHVSIVRGLDYNPEQEVLVSGSRDKTVIIWDAVSWKLKNVIPVLESIETVGFVTQHKLIYTAGERGKIRIWSIVTGKEVTHEQQAGEEGDSIQDVIHHPKLDYILSVHVDQTLLLHSLRPLSDYAGKTLIESLPVIRRISGTHDEVIDLAFLNLDHSFLVLATNSEDLRVVSVASTPASATQNGSMGQYFGADIGILKGHSDIIISLDTDWSGQWLATGAKDNSARLWRIDPNTSNFLCFATFTGHAESLGAIALPNSMPSADSAAYKNPLEHPPPFLITGSQDQTIKCWDIPRTQQSASQRKSLQARYTRKAHDKDINALDTNHRSTLFASASQDRTVKIWTIEKGEVQGVLRGHRRGVWSVRFAPKDAPAITAENGSTSSNRGIILTGSGDKTVKIWSLSDYSCVRTLEGHTNSVLKVLWLPPLADPDNGIQPSLKLASAGGDGLVKVWDASSGEVLCTLDNHTDRVWALAADAETNMLVSGGGDGVITFWKDTTSKTAAATSAAVTQRVEQEQQLQNLIHEGAYRDAITLALQLNHPGRLLALFTSVINTDPPEDGSLTGVKAVDEVLSSLGDEQLCLLLLRIRDWNTNARTANVAQRLLWVLVRTYPASKFISLRLKSAHAQGGKGADSGSLKEVLDALRAYTEKHYKRIEDLVDESYLVEYTLREMDDVAFGEWVGGKGDRGLVTASGMDEQDIIMV